MNLYKIVAPNVHFHENIDSELGGPHWYEDVTALLLAETSGQARAIFARDYGIEFTFKGSILLSARDVVADAPGFPDDDFSRANPGILPEWDAWLAELDTETEKAA